mmetsp:Transcript_6063/g.13989  ORF Transcript_6063/g.13989 Transcript_6063/m.13989 type:complete len:89 (+) Transcript_6063:250-516(+)
MDRKLTELQVEAAGLNTVAVSSSPHRCANNLKGVLVWTDVRRASDMRKRSLQSFLRILSAVQHVRCSFELKKKNILTFVAICRGFGRL